MIPVVLLSSISLEEGTAWLADAGFAGYLAKPIDIDEFSGPGAPLLPARRRLTLLARLACQLPPWWHPIEVPAGTVVAPRSS